MGADWLGKCKKTVHLDCHMPELIPGGAVVPDAAGIVENLARAGAESVYVFAKDHFGNSFYPTAVGHTHKSLAGDLLGGVVNAAREKGIRTIAYLSVCWDERAASLNPDWRQLTVTGERADIAMPWGVVCPNSPYTEESLLPQLAEVCEKYEIGGVFLDIVMFQSNACYCPYCQKKYKIIYGGDMLAGGKPTNPTRHHQFLADSITSLIKKANSLVKRAGKDLAFCCNTSWQMGQDPAVVSNTDLLVIEAQPGHVNRGGYSLLSFQCRYARNLHKPFEILTVRFSQDWGEMSLKETEQLKYEFSVVLANGGSVCCGDQINPNWTVEPAVYRRVGEAFAYVEKYREAYRETVSVKQAAVLSPVVSSYPHSVADFNPSLLGAHKMLTELHIQYDILDAGLFTAGGGYDPAILPEGIVLTDELFHELDTFVKNGGTVLACSNSLGLAPGSPGNANGLNLAGLSFLEPSVYSAAYVLARSPWKDGRAPDFPLLVKERAYLAEAGSAQTVAELYLPVTELRGAVRSFRGEVAPPRKERPYPAVCVNTVGNGEVYYIALDIFKAYWETNHVWLRHLTAPILRKAVRRPLYELDGFSDLEVNMTRGKYARYLHMVNFAAGKAGGGGYAMLEKIPPLRGVAVKLRVGEHSRITLLSTGERLPVRFADGYAEVTVPEIGVYEVLKIEESI